MSIRQTLRSLVCGYCGHRWGSWEYPSSGSCQRKRRCTRCSADDSGGPEHVWADWAYDEADGCDQVRKCSRCGNVEKRTQHDWGNWEYEKPQECGQAQRCLRCSAQRRRGPEHHSSYSSDGKCSRCGGVNPVGRETDHYDPCAEVSCCGMGCEPG